MTKPLLPRVPERLNELSRETLDALRHHPEADQIILGGGVALQHYCDYRETRDLDAWWKTLPDSSTEAVLKETLTTIGQRHGLTLKVRRWGDTQSFELQKSGQTEFSFQISIRTLVLEPPQPSAWPPIQIETLLDNLASKMNALVSRGAPRDFLDVHEVVGRQLVKIAELWDGWKQKNPTGDVKEAQIAVLRHLALLEVRRPLASINDPDRREQAKHVREWVRNHLCGEMTT